MFVFKVMCMENVAKCILRSMLAIRGDLKEEIRMEWARGINILLTGTEQTVSVALT